MATGADRLTRDSHPGGGRRYRRHLIGSTHSGRPARRRQCVAGGLGFGAAAPAESTSDDDVTKPAFAERDRRRGCVIAQGWRHGSSGR
jgi:hypothetical protein